MKNYILPIRFGAVTGIVLIAYFLVLAMFNKHTNPVFSFLNAFITAFGIFETVKFYKLGQGDDFRYSEGIIAGLIAGVVATIIFTAFFLFYITEFNDDFLPELLNTINYDNDISVGLITFVVGTMGVVTALISSFTVMQYFKKSWNIS